MIEVDIALRVGDFDLSAAFDAPEGSVTALFGRPSTWATLCCTSVGCWVEQWMVTSPSSAGTASDAWPSR